MALPDWLSTALLAAMLGAGLFAATITLYQSAPQALRRRTSGAVGAPILVVAAAAAIAPAELTGTPLYDAALTGAVVAAFGIAGATASRHMVVLATLLAVGAHPSAAAAVGIAAAAWALRVRLPAPKAAAGALAAALTLARAAESPRGLAMPMFAMAALVVGASALSRSGPAVRRRAVWTLGGVAALAGVATLGFGVSAASARTDVDRAVEDARAGLRSAREGDVATARTELAEATAGLRDVQGRLRGWSTRAADAVPFVALNARSLRGVVDLAVDLTDAAGKVAAQGDPGTFTLEAGRSNLDVIRAYESPLRDLVRSLDAAPRRLRAARSPWVAPPIRAATERFESEIRPALASAGTALSVVERLPAILGGAGPRRYFVALQNPAELRATGGIIGSYAVVSADRGALKLQTVGRDTDLNTAGNPQARVLRAPADYLARYGGFQPATTWQNVNLSPDFPTVASVIEDLYPQSGGTRVDGVIAMDPVSLAALLRVIGPIQIKSWPVPITPDNAVAVLEHDQYLILKGAARDAFLAEVIGAVFRNATSRSIAAGREFTEVMRPAVRQRNLVVHLSNPEEQEFVASLGLDGRLAPVRGDFLAVVAQNSSGNKIDWFLRRSTSYEVTHDPDSGATNAELTVTLQNLAPRTGEPDIVVGGFGPDPSRRGENRVLLSVYSPLLLRGAAIDGRPFDLRREIEAGRNVYSGFVVVPAGGQLVVRLDLTGELHLGSDYRLDVRHQVLAEPEPVSVGVTIGRGARQVRKATLAEDAVFG